jgi:hypothetical protein
VAGVSRPLALIGALAAAGLLAATATAAPGDPKVSVKPADQAYARTIVLRKADVPGRGWTGKATEFGGLNPDCVVKHYSLSKLTATAQVGTTYTRPVDPGTFLVESDVDVFATPAQAKAASGIATKIGLARCLGSALVAQVPAGAFATTEVHAVKLSGVKNVAGAFKITLHIASSQGKSTLTADVIYLQKGRVLATLSTLTSGKGFTPAQLSAAAAKMAARMTKS